MSQSMLDVQRASAQSKPAKSAFRPDVQGLRAFAVLAVIFAHITGWPTGGFVGVDVFFVISGFLITGLLLREHDKTGHISFTGFYKRRVKRILPASVLVLVVTAAASYFLLPKSRGESTLWDALWSFFFAGNWRFASAGTDYFQEGIAPSPLQHFWSLAVEEQFYFVWPWLMLGVFWIAVRAGRHGSGRIAVGVLMLAITVVSFVWAMWETASNPTVAYFSTFSRAWELGVGALIAVAAPAFSRIPAALRTVSAWIGLAGLALSVIVISSSNAFPAPWAALPVLSTALIIAAGTGGTTRFLWPLTNPVSRYIGDISYSLYLWHWPVAILLVAFIQSATPLYSAIALTVSAVLSVASYHVVEDPIRRSGWLEPKKRKSQFASGAAMAKAGLSILVLATVIVVGYAYKVDLDRKAVAIAPAAPLANTQTTAAAAPCIGAAALDPSRECPPAGSALSPTVDEMANDGGNGFKCWSDESEEMQSCSYGTEGAGVRKIAVVGDSHAGSLIPALTTGIDANKWKLDTYVGNGCQWRTIAPENKFCGTAMQQIQQRLVEGEKYDVVITTASRTKTGSDKVAAIAEFREAWQPVLDRGIKVIIVADVPGVDGAAIECLSRVGFDPANSDCSTTAESAFAQSDTLIEAAKGMQGTAVVDINDMLCKNGKCSAVIGNTIVYRDTAAHLTATYATTLAPYLNQRIQAAVSAP